MDLVVSVVLSGHKREQNSYKPERSVLFGKDWFEEEVTKLGKPNQLRTGLTTASLVDVKT